MVYWFFCKYDWFFHFKMFLPQASFFIYLSRSFKILSIYCMFYLFDGWQRKEMFRRWWVFSMPVRFIYNIPVLLLCPIPIRLPYLFSYLHTLELPLSSVILPKYEDFWLIILSASALFSFCISASLILFSL
jgi:hypothetical protein